MARRMSLEKEPLLIITVRCFYCDHENIVTESTFAFMCVGCGYHQSRMITLRERVRSVRKQVQIGVKW